jgi:heme oxygenase
MSWWREKEPVKNCLRLELDRLQKEIDDERWKRWALERNIEALASALGWRYVEETTHRIPGAWVRKEEK